MQDIKILIGTFLGNEKRNYYGNEAPDKLDIIWKHYLGKGETVISRKTGSVIWAGAGWTGQPLLVEENGQLYLIQGAYNHHLIKLNAGDGQVIWQYAFDDREPVLQAEMVYTVNALSDLLEMHLNRSIRQLDLLCQKSQGNPTGRLLKQGQVSLEEPSPEPPEPEQDSNQMLLDQDSYILIPGKRMPITTDTESAL